MVYGVQPKGLLSPQYKLYYGQTNGLWGATPRSYITTIPTITRTYSSSKMGQPSETDTGPSDDSVSSVSTRHHQSESEEVHSSAKPKKANGEEDCSGSY